MRVARLLLGAIVAVAAQSCLAAMPALSPAAPVLFTPLNERSASFSADGRTVAFTVRLGDGYRQAICISTRKGGRWSEPAVAPFSGIFFDADPYIAANGTIYFASNRSAAGGEKRDFDIWVVDRIGSGWGTPRPLPSEVNSPANETSPSLARSGRLYFASTRSGAGDLYVADPTPTGFGTPRSLGAAVNSPASEVAVAISPDESTLVFAALGRDDETFGPGHLYTRGDLYISHRTGGGWNDAKKLGAPFNTGAADAGPSFSADGSRFYFMSERGFATEQKVTLTTAALMRGLASALNGRGNIYVVDAAVLDAPQ